MAPTLTVIIMAVLIYFSVNGSIIVKMSQKSSMHASNTTLDDLLLFNPTASAVYFNHTTNTKSPNYPDLEPLLEYPRLMKVFIIMCGLPVNEKDCSDYKYAAPELRFFPNEFNRTNLEENKDNSSRGIEIPTNSKKDMKKAILKELVKLKLYTPGAPNFSPILGNDTIYRLFLQADDNRITHLVLAEESEENDTVGRDTILNLLPRNNVLVRIINNRTFYENFGVRYKYVDSPLLIIPRQSRRVIPLHPKKHTGKEYSKAVIKFLDEPAIG
ncbi:hypothetical protein KR067_002088 [Drosophila pandora]|nr:hypothetical protein KR067_002088 [Drosophila pandora]